MKKAIVIFLACALLHGCGAATTYQALGRSGGYSDTQIDENVFQVRFRGNANTSSERSQDFVLLRSAELTLQHGYKYFVTIESNDSTK